MQTDKFYPNSIELADLKKDGINRLRLDDSTEVVVLYDGQELSVIRDLCPHMGAPLSDGHLCTEKKTLQCPWHGYYFDAKDGKFLSNPNDSIFAEMKTKYKCYKPEKTPKWQLKLYKHEIKEGKAYIYRGVL